MADALDELSGSNLLERLRNAIRAELGRLVIHNLEGGSCQADAIVGQLQAEFDMLSVQDTNVQHITLPHESAQSLERLVDDLEAVQYKLCVSSQKLKAKEKEFSRSQELCVRERAYLEAVAACDSYGANLNCSSTDVHSHSTGGKYDQTQTILMESRNEERAVLERLLTERSRLEQRGVLDQYWTDHLPAEGGCTLTTICERHGYLENVAKLAQQTALLREASAFATVQAQLAAEQQALERELESIKGRTTAARALRSDELANIHASLNALGVRLDDDVLHDDDASGFGNAVQASSCAEQTDSGNASIDNPNPARAINSRFSDDCRHESVPKSSQPSHESRITSINTGLPQAYKQRQAPGLFEQRLREPYNVSTGRRVVLGTRPQMNNIGRTSNLLPRKREVR